MFPTKHVAAVEGELYELQCDIDQVAPVQHLMVRWYRDDDNIKTDSYAQPNATQGIVSVSFTLAANFSRGENGSRFRYAPELKNITEDVSVNVGDDVTLDCGAEGYPAPAFRWSRDGVNLPETTNGLNITLATSAIYNCTATNYLGDVTKIIHVHVKKTSIMEAPAALTTPGPSPPISCPLVLTPAKIAVRFGDPVSVNCSTSATRFSKIGWEAISGGMTSTDAVVTWTVEEVNDWDTKPLCYIDVEDGPCSIMLDVTLYREYKYSS
ncbi:Cell adhesion molecule 4 [Liparis tanakae]|uniref:Cell adhesion molecule 4 n=1 Tax=Liparis tanakae TaxID=230148 RepID=A0A4Z2E3U2_9TELE|nr:Cell adhesion molecule 4 [Liparis tanakae]